MLRGGFTDPDTGSSDLTCDEYKCVLGRSCDNYDWKYAFEVLLSTPNSVGDSAYTYITLNSLAVDNTTDGTCNLFLQNLGQPSDQPVIFGSFILQNFNMYFNNVGDK